MTCEDSALPNSQEQPRPPYPTGPATPPGDLYDKTLARVRNAVVLLLGVGIVVHETLFTNSPQPVLLILAAGLLGLPLALGLDRKLQ